MKKLVCLVLALLISLLSAFAVHAEETGTVNLTDAHAYETATSLCFIEDTLYVLGSYGVYEYKDGELKTLVDLTDAYINMTQADNLYQASLSATVKILGTSLLNYI